MPSTRALVRPLLVGAAAGGISRATADPPKPAKHAVIGGVVGLVVDIIIVAAFIAAVDDALGPCDIAGENYPNC
jgi:hypothetical protein